MKKGGSILLAYDGSEGSDRALVEAREIGERYAAKLTVLRVYWGEAADLNLNKGETVPGDEPQEIESHWRKVKEVLTGAKLDYRLLHERSYDTALSILENANKNKSALIVMGRGGKRNSIGSTSAKVAAAAPCNILLVK